MLEDEGSQTSLLRPAHVLSRLKQTLPHSYCVSAQIRNFYGNGELSPSSRYGTWLFTKALYQGLAANS